MVRTIRGDRGSIATSEIHTTGSYPSEWQLYELDDTLLISWNPPESTTPRTLRIGGTTDNPRVLAQHDAVLYDGVVCWTRYVSDRRATRLSHPYLGTVEHLRLERWLDDELVYLDRLPSPRPEQRLTDAD